MRNEAGFAGQTLSTDRHSIIEAKAWEILRATPHAPECSLAKPFYLRDGGDHCECDREVRAMLAFRDVDLEMR